MRREKVLKGGKLTESWKLLSECRRFLEETCTNWQKRTREEAARIKEAMVFFLLPNSNLIVKYTNIVCSTRWMPVNIRYHKNQTNLVQG